MMKYELMHPCDQIALFMSRVYSGGMTTTSGGNISILDDNNDMWISPAGVDKGTLLPQDIVRVKANGEIRGRHRPSSEYPFHKAIYAARPDMKAIIHAHPAALVAFSIVREIPNTHILPQAESVCGKVGYAPYALPGSPELGEKIAQTFASGYDTVLLENHGVVCGGKTLLQAFQRFETLDFCARLIIKAKTIGDYKVLSEDQFKIFRHNRHFLPEYRPERHSNKEKKLRKFMCEIIHRAYNQHIMTSTEGALSTRLNQETFLITPYGVDRRHIEEEDIVLVSEGHREHGKLPSRSVLLHKTIYEQHPHIKSIISAQAPNVTAFGVTDKAFDTRTIPESYIMLRDVPKFPYGAQFSDDQKLANVISEDCPVILLENDAILATGKSLLEAYDRLEVAEFTARSLINAMPLGSLVSMDDAQIDALKTHFLQPK